MIVGGWHEQSREDLDDVEVIDLSGSGGQCHQKKFPNPMEGGVGVMGTGDKPLICGGSRYQHGIYDTCYQYDPTEKEWKKSEAKMLEGRVWTAWEKLSETKVIIFGGNTASGISETTEILDLSTNTFSYGPALPEGPLVLPCATRLNATHIFMSGGSETPSAEPVIRRTSWLLDVERLQWSEFEPMIVPRVGHKCHRVGDEVVVVGNDLDQENSVEILDLPTLTWRLGSELKVGQPATVEYKDSFLVIGGFAQPELESLETLYAYDSQGDWTLMEERMDIARDTAIAFVMRDEDVC